MRDGLVGSDTFFSAERRSSHLPLRYVLFEYDDDKKYKISSLSFFPSSSHYSLPVFLSIGDEAIALIRSRSLVRQPEEKNKRDRPKRVDFF